MDESDNDSDDWAKDELPDLPLPMPRNQSTAHEVMDDDDSEWEQKLAPPTVNNKSIDVLDDDRTENDDMVDTGEPIIIVDMTILSQRLSLSEIHCRFDPNSVNNVIAVKALRQQIENQYHVYSKNMDYISERVVIPCGSSVYRPALVELRQERPGHYFYPIFPPKLYK